MTSLRLTLESFEADALQDTEHSEDFKRGFEAGLAEGEASQAASTAQSVAAVSSSLTDMAFGFEEARLHLLDRLRPLLGQLADAIVPQIARDSFGAHLVEAAENACDIALGTPVSIAVSLDDMPSLADLIVAKQFEFTADPTLTAGQATIGHGDTNILLDLTALTKELHAVLNGIEQSERIPSHG